LLGVRARSLAITGAPDSAEAVGAADPARRHEAGAGENPQLFD
jgi:hypothetical protein